MSDPQSLVVLSQAARMLAEAKSLDDVVAIRNTAEAARVYARAQGLGVEAMNHAAEVKLRAERKAGELLKLSAERGERATRQTASSHSVELEEVPRLADLGISKQQSSRWQEVAEIPEPAFEGYLKAAKDNAQAITTAGAVSRRAQQDGSLRASAVRVLLPAGKYRVVLADPPWQYDFAPTASRAIENQYGTLDVTEIAGYRDATGRHVSDVAADDAACFMWATAPKLTEALTVLDAWGFDYVTNLVWVKDRIGMGFWARSQHELVLVGKRGRMAPPPESERQSSVFDGRRTEHSVKPSLHEWIERAFPGGGYVELFSRRARDGWAAFGNEVAA